MSRLFKEKAVSGNIFQEQDESKEIFIVKKGFVVLKKGEIKVAEIGSGKIFGHENALSEQVRSISAETKGPIFCTLYVVNVFDLSDVVSIDLLKNLMKQGRKKLEQYQETSFKFNHSSDSKQQQAFHNMNKPKNDPYGFLNNQVSPLIHAKSIRSQSSHIQGRPHRYNQSQANTKSQSREQFNILNIIKQRLTNQQGVDSSKNIEKTPKECQTAVSYSSVPSNQTTHQIQKNGLIITMGVANQANERQTIINNYQSNNNESEQTSSEDGQDQLLLQNYQSNKTEYQGSKLYSSSAKRAITSGSSNVNFDHRKILSRKMFEAKDVYNQSKTASTDQSWFVIKRLNTPSRTKKTLTEWNSRYQSNVISPASFYQNKQPNSKDFASFSNLMTMVGKSNNINNVEEQEGISPMKQRATLTSYIKGQKNGQSRVFSLTNKPFQNQIKENNNYLLYQSNGSNVLNDSMKVNEIPSLKQEEKKQENNYCEGQIQQQENEILSQSINSEDEDEDRQNFNLESKYKVNKRNIIQQSKYGTMVQSNQNSQLNDIQSNNIDLNEYSSLNMKSNQLNNTYIQIKKAKQIEQKNSLNPNAQEKIEVIPQLGIPKRPLSHISQSNNSSKIRGDSQNSQFSKYQPMNAQQSIQGQFPTKINIISQTNVLKFDEYLRQQRKSSPQLFNNKMLNMKLEKSEDSSRISSVQMKISSEKQSSSPTSSQNTFEMVNNRKLSFGSLQNASQLIQFKRNLLNSPDIYKVSDFINENQFQDDQFSKGRDSERLKQGKDQQGGELRQPTIQNITQNIKIKIRTNSCQTNRTLSISNNNNNKKAIIKAIN